MVNILQLIKVLPVLLVLCSTSVLAQNESGNPVAVKFVCNNTHFLNKLKNVVNEQEVRAILKKAIDASHCVNLDKRYIFWLKNKVNEFYSYSGYTEIWQTHENAFILMVEEEREKMNNIKHLIAL
tara:strand:- start:1855 stop:2229 length:375 start_codon:yes stop_codon:yes gene_type:complete